MHVYLCVCNFAQVWLQIMYRAILLFWCFSSNRFEVSTKQCKGMRLDVLISLHRFNFDLFMNDCEVVKTVLCSSFNHGTCSIAGCWCLRKWIVPFKLQFSYFRSIERRKCWVTGKVNLCTSTLFPLFMTSSLQLHFCFCFCRVKKREEKILGDLLRDLQKERERCKSLEAQVTVIRHFPFSLSSVSKAIGLSGGCALQFIVDRGWVCV